MKLKLKDYLVGELAKFYGMTIDAIRLYDKKGILSPPKNGENNYRTYSRENFITMDYVMRMRKMGLHLEDIKVMLNDYNLEDMNNIVATRAAQIEAEICALRRKQVLLDDYGRLLTKSLENFDKPSITMSPYFIQKDIEMSMFEVMQHFEEIGGSTLPLLSVYIESDAFLSDELASRLVDDGEREQVGDCFVTMSDWDGTVAQAVASDNRFHVLPPQKCVYAVICIHTNIDYNGLKPILQFVEKQHIKPIARPLFRMIAIEKNVKDSAEYYEMWLPVQA